VHIVSQREKRSAHCLPRVRAFYIECTTQRGRTTFLDWPAGALAPELARHTEIAGNTLQFGFVPD